MKSRSYFPIPFSVLLMATLVLVVMSQSAFALEEDKKVTVAPGGQTLGGPGIFEGDDGDAKTALSLPNPRTLCVTLGGRKGTTRAYFDLAPDFAVTKDVTMSVCQEAVSAVEVRCEGGKCESSWRVDTVGADGEDGAQGPAGPQGSQGIQGVAGPAGSVGLQGVQGPPGVAGPQGFQGPVGAQGPPGPAGPQGDAAKWHASAGAPAGNLGEIGDFYLDTDTGDIHEKTATATWTLKDNLTGPQGSQGIQGVAGPGGPAGPQGTQGPAGPQGPQGNPGVAGPEGQQGLPGISNYVRIPVQHIIGVGVFQTITVGCPSGSKVLGGGYETANDLQLVRASFPVSDTQWRVQVRNTDLALKTITVFAVCATVS